MDLGQLSASRPSTSASSASTSRRRRARRSRARRWRSPRRSTTVNDCLNTDLTQLQTTNLKAEVQLFKGNKLSLFNNFAKKVRNARGADDLNPIETTTRAGARCRAATASDWWNTGPTPTYKFGDQWVVSDRLLLDVQYAHVGNNFILDFHRRSCATCSRRSSSSTGLNGRSGRTAAVVNIRPVNSVNVNANYFMPGTMGGDHAFKFGGYWNDAKSHRSTHTGGYATRASRPRVTNDCCAWPRRAARRHLTRDGVQRCTTS